MRDQVGKFLLAMGWLAERGGYQSAHGDYRIDFDGFGIWILLQFSDADDSDDVAMPSWEWLDEGDTVGELKLALAGLKDQTTQGAI